MPQISDIKPGRRGSRYSVYVDGVYAFSLGELELKTTGLTPGAHLTSEELTQHKAQAEESRVQAQALRYLGVRPRSVAEMNQYLGRQGHDEATIARALQYLERLGYLNDQAFAESWVEYRQNGVPRSRLRLASELRAKGIETSLIDQVLSTQDTITQKEMLRTVIAKKRHLYKSEQKLISYCSRQGFPLELIRSILQEN